MKSTYIFPVALAVVILILGSVYFFTISKSRGTYQVLPGSESSSSTPNEASNPTSAVHETTKPTGTITTPTPAQAGIFTIAQVATHSSAQSCWTAINGNVYDVTTWITQHPGGAAAILSLCGTDGSASFNGQHGGQRRPEAELASFKIGTLN